MTDENQDHGTMAIDLRLRFKKISYVSTGDVSADLGWPICETGS